MATLESIFDWHATLENSENIIAYVDWDDETIYIVDENRETVAEHRGVKEPSLDSWEIRDPSGVSVTVKVQELPVGTGLKVTADSRVSRDVKDRECQTVQGATEPCKAYSGGSYQITTNTHKECTFVVAGSVCTEEWKKIGTIQYYRIAGCIQGTEHGSPQDYHGFVCT